MKTLYPWHTLAAIPLTMLAMVGCGDDGSSVECGAGTTLMGDSCVPAGTPVTCGSGTELMNGECLPTGSPVLCGEGTILVSGECVPDDGEEPLLTFALAEEESGYAELVADIEAMDAADADNHLDQAALAMWATMGTSLEQLEFLFDHGDELTEINFTELDGAGSLTMPDGSPLASRFTRVPTGGRFTGPNATSCLSCHSGPIGNSGGPNVANVMQDPEPAVPGLFNARQTISIQGGGLIQILAEDMTTDLLALKDQALANPNTEVELKSNDVSFGSITCDDAGECNYENLAGVSPDLIVRPMGWKGNFPTLRGFSADAAFGEMGMQPDEVLWLITEPGNTETPSVDGDGDGVARELSVGDVTALTLYLALQEMPTTVIELADAGLAELSDEDRAMITAGEARFSSLGCDGCHVSEYTISTTLFEEPSTRVGGLFEAQDLTARNVGYSAASPLVVDLSSTLADEPRAVKESDGSSVIRPYTDLKRHFMGNHLADDAKAYFPKSASQIDVTELPDDADASSLANVDPQIGLGEFLTPELWGVGNTGPWLHDGRAVTLREAILLHGEETPTTPASEAQAARDAFASLNKAQQDEVLAFLLNLVLVDMSDEE